MLNLMRFVLAEKIKIYILFYGFSIGVVNTIT